MNQNIKTISYYNIFYVRVWDHQDNCTNLQFNKIYSLLVKTNYISQSYLEMFLQHKYHNLQLR